MSIRDKVDVLLQADRAASAARNEAFALVYALLDTFRAYEVPGAYVPPFRDDVHNLNTLDAVRIGPRSETDRQEYLHIDYTVHRSSYDDNEVLQYPMSLVENPTREAMVAYIESERLAREERQREEKRKSEAHREATEREVLQRLKAKYEK